MGVPEPVTANATCQGSALAASSPNARTLLISERGLGSPVTAKGPVLGCPILPPTEGGPLERERRRPTLATSTGAHALMERLGYPQQLLVRDGGLVNAKAPIA